MKLGYILDLRKGNIVSIVGAGGKTSLMYCLSEELRFKSRVLITTTTKIYMPQKDCYDFLAIGENNFDIKPLANGTYLYGKTLNEENKIIGLSKDIIENELHYFDYVLIEADGSKKRSIKGWKDNEPVISSNTDKTIGVLSIEALGKVINDINVHRIEQFLNITNARKGEIINTDHILSLIFHPKGLFKDSKGERILFINKVDSSKEAVLAYKLLELIIQKNMHYIDKIIIGSLKNREYRFIKI